MPRLFVLYCVVLVSLLAIANARSYVLTSLSSGSQKADKAANHYHK